jgi:hypothetical protein
MIDNPPVIGGNRVKGCAMFIRTVDESLERMVRAELPLPDDLGDVTFDAPTSNWSAQLSRITVNFFLYDVGLSDEPSRSPMRRVTENGQAERRVPQPIIRLGYLVSAWAGSPRDEHQLLGDLVSRFASRSTLPEEYLTSSLSSSVHLRLCADDANKPRDVWSGSGGQLKASFTMEVSVAADTFGWQDEAPAVTRIEALTNPKPRPPTPIR